MLEHRHPPPYDRLSRAESAAVALPLFPNTHSRTGLLRPSSLIYTVTSCHDARRTQHKGNSWDSLIVPYDISLACRNSTADCAPQRFLLVYPVETSCAAVCLPTRSQPDVVGSEAAAASASGDSVSAASDSGSVAMKSNNVWRFSSLKRVRNACSKRLERNTARQHT